VILCAGKVYYDLANRRDTIDRKDVAIVRVEQLSPFPAGDVRKMLDQYPNHEQVTWVQEEPRNHAAFFFVERCMRELLDIEVDDITRVASPSPAGGSTAMHEQEQQKIVLAAIDGGGEKFRSGARKSPQDSKKTSGGKTTARSN
jgi:2-oxoglutarate dehydrogenase E1 component